MFLRFPFFCRCYHSGIGSWLREGAGSHGCGSLLPGCAGIRGSVSLGAPTAAQDSRAVCNILPDHTDPGMGIKLISKRQEKQPAGQPELSLPESLQIILASTSQREKQVPYASVTVPQCSKTAQVRSNANSVLMRTKAPPVGKDHILRDAKGPLHFQIW